MTNKKIIPTIFVLALLALGACSISSGGGEAPPRDVTVVVPPGSTTVSP